MKDRNVRLRRISELDPEKDYREITALFYLDFQAIMVLQAVTGNLMTFAVPRMSRILSATKQFENHTAKRMVDTTLLVQAVLDHGLGAGEGRDAARRVNAMHRQYDIHADDFVAVGCDVPIMSLEIADRFGWRPVTDAERESLRIHYSAEARAFGSHRPLPETLPEMRAYWHAYLDENTAFEPQNRRLADAFLTFLPQLFPRPLRPFVSPILLAQVDPRILRACGLPEPSARRKRISTRVMRALGRTGPAPDLEPGERNVIEKLAESLYPNGWTVHTLGTHVPSATQP
ncbi:oxygenase MpaB family protein [Actinophytocola sp.]|uniref:oxygenase MpaB family protein n=1 Tax=Actinophytocola sp. TaxID=1872138 RepID=UPI002ED28CFE